MNHKHRYRRAFALAAGVALLATASPAYALSSDTTGAEAYGNSNGNYRVYDTLCDGHSAYGLYINEGASGQARRNNNGGCNTILSGTFAAPVSAVKACRDKTLAPDNCGGWNEW